MFLAIDQFNQKYLLQTKHPKKELLEIFSATNATKIYQDDKSGQSYHAGYLIQGLWLTLYKVSEFRKQIN